MLRCTFATPSHFPSFCCLFCLLFDRFLFSFRFFHHLLSSHWTRLAASGAADAEKLMIFFFSRRCGLMHKQPHLAVGSTDVIESLSHMMMGGRFPTTTATILISHILCRSASSPLNTNWLAGGRILVWLSCLRENCGVGSLKGSFQEEARGDKDPCFASGQWNCKSSETRAALLIQLKRY